MAKIEIKDESGDRKYFTIIPNFILNHSTMWDREVYIQMKRFAGESRTCYASRATLSKQCGMSARRLDASIKYLIEHNWINFIGKKTVQTKGGDQEVNEYEIADLWKMNIDYYENKKGVAQDTLPSRKGVARKTQRGSTVEAKGVAHGAHKEEQELRRIREEEENSPSPDRFFKEAGKQEDVILWLISERKMQEKFARAEVMKFVSYWTERSASGKMRWQGEKYFDLRRRFATWFSKAAQYNAPRGSNFDKPIITIK
jgi:hypothetical protein